MDCDVCSREFNAKRRPLCTACAQATIYPSRVQQALALLGREKQHSHAEAVVRPGNDGVLAALPQDADWDAITLGVKNIALESLKVEQAAVESRIERITEKAAELRKQIDSYKECAAQQKQTHTKHRQLVGAQSKDLESHKPRVEEPVRLAIKKAHYRLDKVHSRTADARRLLCWEAASLAGLTRTKYKDGKYEYWLGGVPVLDLRNLQKSIIDSTEPATRDKEPTLSHELVSASLDNICRLLGSCCHHLSVRLPAEIMLPHNDFPHSVIMPEKSSYKSFSTVYPGKASSQSASPAASRLMDGNGTMLPRPRLLHLDRPLPQLLKDNPKAFHRFVEGVMLLAWNVAWLCRMQGLDSVNTFDDVCNIGKNLYHLFLGEDQNRPILMRNPSSAPTIGLERANANAPTAVPRIGSYSHGSAYHSLSSHEGLKLLRGWRLASPARLVDKLKSWLLNEISGAEWDFLSGEEWDEEQDQVAAVLVGEKSKLMEGQDPAMSVMTVGKDEAYAEQIKTNGPDRYGRAGWMKVRGRGEND